MTTMTAQVKAKLKHNPNPDPETITKWADEIGCSKALVYKWLNRMPQEQRQTVQPSEPVLKIEEEPEEHHEEEPEFEERNTEFEVPSFEEPEKFEPSEEEEGESVIAEEELGEKEQRLKDISARAVGRLFDVAFSDLLDLEKVGLTKQESDDTNFLVMLMVSKYLKVEVAEYMLEFTCGLHFGSIGVKALVAWWKKRKEEKEQEKPVNLPPPKEEPKAPEPEEKAEPEPETEEKAPLCVACGKQPIDPESKMGLCKSCIKKAESDFTKKFRR